MANRLDDTCRKAFSASEDTEEVSTNASECMESQHGIFGSPSKSFQEGFLARVAPPWKRACLHLNELLANQAVLVETISQQNALFQDQNTLSQIDGQVKRIALYKNKLLKIKNHMHEVSAKSKILKKRSLRLQQQKEQKDMMSEQLQELERERERELIPKVLKK